MPRTDGPMPPADIMAAAKSLAEGAPESVGFAVVRHCAGHAYDVWVGEQWALKRRKAEMAAEDPRWRRSPVEVMEWYQEKQSGMGQHLPATVLVGDVLVQERADPDPHQFYANEPLVQSLAQQLGIGNICSPNVGWRDGVPVFLDVEYRGPDLTVILLLKMPRGRTWQGEHQFWAEWGPTYLSRMVRNIRKWLPADTRIVVMTDRPDVVPAGCDIFLLPEDHPGWWSKLFSFRRDVACGRCLYLDLDNVVAGPLTELLNLQPSPMIMMDDRHRPGMPNASTMLFFAECVRYLWDEYAKDPEGWRARFPETAWPNASDQAYVTSQLLAREGRYMPYFQDLLGEGYIVNSRTELEAGAPWEKAQLCFGCWTPKNHEQHSAFAQPFYDLHWSDR
jgi:hypothetical protein